MFQAVRKRLGYRILAATLAAAAASLLFALCGATAPAWASSSCPNEVFRTGPGANLPDCRAYELVSPPNKNGGQVDGGFSIESEPGPNQAAADGEAITYGSETTFTEADPGSSLTTTQYMSVRGPDGWSTKAITPRQALPGGIVDETNEAEDWSLFQGFTENLDFGYLDANEPAPVAGAPAGYYSPYLQDESDGAYTLLSSVTPPVQPLGRADKTEGFQTQYAGMTEDGSHVIFEANDALTPGAAPGRVNLYEWSNGKLELVNVLPDGATEDGGSERITSKGPSLAFGAMTEESEAGPHSNFGRALSTNGTRAFWTGSGADHQIYMHEITADGARAVEVSVSQKTNGSGPDGSDPNGPLPAHYWTASADGSLVYFTSCEQLTNESTARFFPDCGSDELRGEDLYQYNANIGALTDISVDHNAGEAADVKGVVGASEDGSYVYFVAGGVLAEGASPLIYPEEDQVDAFNLYLWHDGKTTFISKIGAEYDVENGDWNQGLNEKTSRVSPNGQYLAFQSVAPLTGYDNIPASPKACQVEGGFYNKSTRCMEVFEYDAATSKLICVSCNPTGLPPVGRSEIPESFRAESEVLGWQSSTVQQRYLLSDGRSFFTSDDSILPQASNGKQNVYEYEPEGVGSCRSSGGCVDLISSGTGIGASWFEDASADGNNVFFLTDQQLAPQDGDEAMDIYDARVDGGFSAPVPASCSGEACRPPVAPAPAIYQAPPSATFAGPGNPVVQPSAVKPSTKKSAKKKAKPKKKRAKKKSKKGKKAGVGASNRHSRRFGKVGK
ncbi:MAG TPA: hypothetical protein VNV42_14900 [Solirubrobacteraceae bacterium]|jgi:hypothetical protein|nr:hypothetical protein [Solirubrobacteraceae bacterium]